MSHTSIRFRISLARDKCLKYYRGTASSVQVQASDGRSIRFPANLLLDHVRHNGVIGEFLLTVDQNHRAVSLRRIGD